MPIFKDSRKHIENEVMLQLLTKIAEDPKLTQRRLAKEIGISLGLLVNYMSSCVHKGLIKAKKISPRRLLYFVTPEGISQKSQMVACYLNRSMAFFRDTRLQLDELFNDCNAKGIQKIAMVGQGDVADIARLVADNIDLQLVSLDDTERLKSFNVVLITDTVDPQGTFDKLRQYFAADKLLTIDILCIVRKSVSQLS